MANLEDSVGLLNKGDIIVFKTKGITGLIVKLITKQDYTHSAIYNGGGSLIESDFGGVQINSLKKYRGVEFAVHRNEQASSVSLKKVSTWCLSKVGCGYDYLGVLGLGMYILGFRDNNKLDDKRRFWCHEFVADAYLRYGLMNSLDKHTRRTTANDLVNGLKLVVKG